MSYGGGYSTTSYGAQGGAGGGGFMAGGGSQQETAGNKGYGKDTLRPLTIKQIVEADLPHPDADFKVDGTEITQITFVGQIRNISTQATNHTYRLDDGTGTIEVKQWIDPDANNSDGENMNSSKPKLVENGYARVWGRLKAFNNKRHVGAHVIRPVEDLNEVQYHLLEATAVHLYFTKGPLGSKDAANGAGEAYGQSNGDGANGNNAGGKPLPAGLSSAARKVHECLRTSPQTNEGLHIQDIAVRVGLDMADVGRAGDELQHNGLIYTTVDDNTWALLEDF